MMAPVDGNRFHCRVQKRYRHIGERPRKMGRDSHCEGGSRHTSGCGSLTPDAAVDPVLGHLIWRHSQDVTVEAKPFGAARRKVEGGYVLACDGGQLAQIHAIQIPLRDIGQCAISSGDENQGAVWGRLCRKRINQAGGPRCQGSQHRPSGNARPQLHAQHPCGLLVVPTSACLGPLESQARVPPWHRCGAKAKVCAAARLSWAQSFVSRNSAEGLRIHAARTYPLRPFTFLALRIRSHETD